MGEERGRINWRVFWIVLITVVVLLPLLAFVAQRLISPGSGSSGTTVETVKTTEKVP